MTTTITENEIKLIYIELILVAIIGIFMFFYVGAPVQPSSMRTTEITAQGTEVSSSDASWISGMITTDLGFGKLLPLGAVELIVVSSIFLVPLTIMNLFVAIRFIKDIATGWV